MINNEIVYLAERIENLPQISVFVFIKGLQSLTEAIKIMTEYSWIVSFCSSGATIISKSWK